MKKAIALALVLVTLVLFASCNKNSDENNTTTSIIPVDTQIFESVSTATTVKTETQSQTESTGATMILTSKAGETMPTIVTTMFNPANETTAITVPASFEIQSVPMPEVNTSVITTVTTATEHTEPTEPKTNSSDDNKIDTAGKKSKALQYTSFGLSASNNVTIEFDANGWNGGVKSGKFNAQIKSDDGNSSSVVGRVVGIQNSDGYFSVVIPVGDIVTEEVNSLNITIPAGAVTSRKNDQTSKSYTATISVN